MLEMEGILLEKEGVSASTNTPVLQEPYRSPETILAGIKTELELLLSQGKITRSDSA